MIVRKTWDTTLWLACRQEREVNDYMDNVGAEKFLRS